MLNNDHQFDEVRPRPRIPQRVGCTFGKHDDLAQLITVRTRVDGALVVVYVEHKALTQGVKVGDVLVEARSLSSNGNGAAESMPLFGRNEGDTEVVFERLPRPMLLTVWRTDEQTPRLTGDNLASTLGYKCLNLPVTPKAAKGLTLIQPSMHDRGRFQIGAASPIAVQDGFVVGDDLVGIDFFPMDDEEVTPEMLQRQIEHAKVLNVMRWKTNRLSVTSAGTRRLPHYSSNESFRRRSEITSTNTVTI